MGFLEGFAEGFKPYSDNFITNKTREKQLALEAKYKQQQELQKQLLEEQNARRDSGIVSNYANRISKNPSNTWDLTQASPHNPNYIPEGNNATALSLQELSNPIPTAEELQALKALGLANNIYSDVMKPHMSQYSSDIQQQNLNNIISQMQADPNVQNNPSMRALLPFLPYTYGLGEKNMWGILNDDRKSKNQKDMESLKQNNKMQLRRTPQAKTYAPKAGKGGGNNTGTDTSTASQLNNLLKEFR